MELRHLRYFVAVAEAGGLTIAAERRLHTAQPSLSRQIRDLEHEVGVPLFARTARGMTLTPAGRAFLDHARAALAEAEAATAAARRAAAPERRSLALGFLTGCEPQWLPAVTHVLRDELPDIELTIVSKHSPQLAEALAAGTLDAAFMRAETGYAGLAYTVLDTEPLIVILPSDHRLAAREAIRPQELVGETFVAMADQAPVLSGVIDGYLRRSAIKLKPAHRVEYLSMAISLVASTRGIAFLPAFARKFLTWSVVSRPLEGEPPTIDLVLGRNKTNASPALRLLLSRTDALIGKARQAP